MSKYLSVWMGLMLIFFASTLPAYAVSPLYFYDWYHGTGGQVKPSGYPGWLENQSRDKENMAKAVKWELYTGYPDRNLKLTNSITRAEFAVALARVLDAGEDGGTPWYTLRIKALKEEGIISSTSGDWSAPITRGEMGQWMGRAAQKYRADIKNKNVSFTDTKDSDILNAARAGVINGYEDDSFKSAENAQRVHAALMLVRLAEVLNTPPLPGAADLKTIAQKAFQREQEAREAWVLGKDKNLDFSNALDYASELNLDWLVLVEKEYQKQKPDYGWAEDVLTYSAQPVELHRTTAVIKVSGQVQNYDKRGNKLYNPQRYEGLQYFIKRDGKWLLTHEEPA